MTPTQEAILTHTGIYYLIGIFIGIIVYGIRKKFDYFDSDIAAKIVVWPLIFSSFLIMKGVSFVAFITDEVLDYLKKESVK